MNQMDLEDLHDNIITETHPEDTKRHLATVLTIESVNADDPEGLLGDLFDAIMMCVGTDSDLDEPVIRALSHLVEMMSLIATYGADTPLSEFG